MPKSRTIALQADGAKKTVSDPPVTLLLKRTSIRSFLDGKKVALYYIKSLNRYISIPFDSKEDISESLFNKLKNKLTRNRQMNDALNRKHYAETRATQYSEKSKSEKDPNLKSNHDWLSKAYSRKAQHYKSFINKHGNKNNLRAASSDTKHALNYGRRLVGVTVDV